MSVTTAGELRATAERGAAELGPDASAKDVLVWATETFGDGLVVASAMQDAMMIDLVTSVKPDVDVLFLDTGYHFAETIGTRDAVKLVYDRIRIVNAQPDQTVAEQDATEGKDLFASRPDRCCHLRKVVPLQRSLAGYDAWVTGVKRADGPSRADTPLVTFDEKFGLVKINPVAAWTEEEAEEYVREHGVLVNPLVGAGYPSIGCAPCTAKVEVGADLRSGRWAGQAKTECGLHS
ncbi:phosphoadenylyl-sulfate reductase [Pseudonocardia endophytica]|uniref:Adenosine 5'-phosphosulfate reductase n=1 Tax=Pseudonocardia endophytica TaxID=401976 RepID=A0A4R1HLN4_PSEEN|nr:phosphoadenylyl-sulfate reductase [Pseudonocardia endophytica]TCK21210.1 phosphoadenylylsulfate reductase (thioredoxin) [Pseudonocardia endophytica]